MASLPDMPIDTSNAMPPAPPSPVKAFAPTEAPAFAQPAAIPYAPLPPRTPTCLPPKGIKTIILPKPPNSKSFFCTANSTLYKSTDRPGLVCKVAIPEEGPLESMAIERRIYERLIPLELPNLVRVERMDENGIWMRYARYGCLRLFDKDGNGAAVVGRARRIQWCEDVARVVAALHEQGIRHGDLSGRNLLVAGEDDTDESTMEIQLCDFGGSAIDDQKAKIFAESGYRHPSKSEYNFPTIRCEIHTLGSTFYEILMAHQVYDRLPDWEINKLIEAGTYPDLTSVPMKEIVQKCWTGEFKTATEVADAVATFRRENA
ncbi:Protein kinase-like domain protein [Niveomyces insectorum RCEF 264]|uniref:EKC/KEOPS complex subunit BUD32 n=1 Tax=Niveomyces insectorum RCEF 264 TaxID=1081102 RepID=A0A167W293_9HYPO|nr:Protein kinase-like domain protein [Niveomyces insectorum RCEF 264]